MLTQGIQYAINFAGKAHGTQKRKGTDVPYIVHPMSVAMILAHYDFDEHTIIAGILHDVLEDTTVTQEELAKEFHSPIANYVRQVTEQDKSLPWAERKREAMKKIASMDRCALAIKTADAISNMTDILLGYNKEGDVYFDNFKKGKDAQLARYSVLIRTILESSGHRIGYTAKQNLIFEELQSTLNALLDCF